MRRDDKVRNFLLGLAAVRIVIGLAAIPLAPLLWEEHFVVLVLMRPTKEVLLAGGFLVRLGEVWIVPLLVAAVPLAIFGVWQAYYLGRFHAPQIRSGKMPWFAKKILKPERVKVMQRLLKRKGMKLVLLGRLAVFPSALVAAAAGSGDVKSRKFLPADTIGGLLSIAEAIGLGYLLGQAYEEAGPWISAAGAGALVFVAVIVARALKQEQERKTTRKKKQKPRRRSGGRGRKAAAATSRS